MIPKFNIFGEKIYSDNELETVISLAQLRLLFHALYRPQNWELCSLLSANEQSFAKKIFERQ